MTTLLLYTNIDNTYTICSIICYITHDINDIADSVFLQHGYIVLKDTYRSYTICNITLYITIYIVD